MKPRTFLLVAVLVAVFFAGCSKGGSQVQVVSAVYGESTNFADVTYRVRDLLKLQTGFQVHPSFLQADPLVGYNKVLVIVYDANGRQQILAAYEGDTVSAGGLLRAAK